MIRNVGISQCSNFSRYFVDSSGERETREANARLFTLDSLLSRVVIIVRISCNLIHLLKS